ncbi:MAG: DUF1700 domain-containing protein [Lachnospiraceae bacterium]|nr:DUF1700 domain-containing protein [Lachnospiraceae bacterium]
MNKNAFIKELSKRLRYIPKEDREDAVEYYTELMSDMGFDETEDVTVRLGTAKDAAKKILDDCTQKHADDYAEKKTLKGHATVVWLSVLGVMSLPVSLPLAIIVLAFAITMIVVVLTLLISFAVVALSLVFAGLACLAGVFIAPGIQKLTVFGTGLASLGIGFLLGYGLFALIRALFRKMFRRDKAESKA